MNPSLLATLICATLMLVAMLVFPSFVIPTSLGCGLTLLTGQAIGMLE